MSHLTAIETHRPNETNFQLHIDKDNSIWSVAIVPGAKTTFFGNRKHLERLIRERYFDVSALNESGIEFLAGMHSRVNLIAA